MARTEVTHILDPEDHAWTICGLDERKTLDPVLSYPSWCLQDSETCVGCEAGLRTHGLEPRA